MAFYVEKPADEWYNIGMWSKVDGYPYPIIEAERVDDHTLKVIAPERIATKWPTLHPKFYLEVPSFLGGRNLSYEEYVALFPNVTKGWSDIVMEQLAEVLKLPEDYEVLYGDEFDCYQCAGTRLDGDGFHDCPVCMKRDEDDYEDYEDDEGR